MDHPSGRLGGHALLFSAALPLTDHVLRAHRPSCALAKLAHGDLVQDATPPRKVLKGRVVPRGILQPPDGAPCDRRNRRVAGQLSLVASLDAPRHPNVTGPMTASASPPDEPQHRSWQASSTATAPNRPPGKTCARGDVALGPAHVGMCRATSGWQP